MSKRGCFITFEGCDGSGKTTQKRMLIEYLRGKGCEVVDTREPGGTPAAERIREILLDGSLKINDTAELLLYTASRAEHYYSVIKPAVDNGKIVVCDRYLDSTLAYQGYARGLGSELILKLFGLTTPDGMPDITLFVDISSREAFCRKGGAENGDRLELEGDQFHAKVYDGFVKLAELYPDRIKRVDARGTKAQTAAKIIEVVDVKLGL